MSRAQRGGRLATILAAALAGACAGSSAGGDAPVDAVVEPEPDAAVTTRGDGFPPGAISFFMATFCPAGWSPYADAVGRTIIPSPGAGAGMPVGTAWAANQEPAHRHALAIAVDLPAVSYVGIVGGGNHGVTRGGRVEGTAATDATVDAVPYAQLRVCRKTAPSGDRTPPRGVIAFFATPACPAPWTEAATALHGRVMVALPAGGTPGATFGGEPLAPGEARTHVHPVTATLAAAAHGIGLASGCCGGGYGAAGTHVTTTTAAPAPVDVPYLQLLACLAP